jgi:hypothetical protein
MILKSFLLEIGWFLAVCLHCPACCSRNQLKQRYAGHGFDRTAFKVKLRCTKTETVSSGMPIDGAPCPRRNDLPAALVSLNGNNNGAAC